MNQPQPTAQALPRRGLSTIHASAVLLGEAAVLLRGPSGAGKTTLALALLAEARRRGLFARFVADDRVVLRPAGGRLLVAPHPAIAGRVERRFAGIHAIDSENVAVARLVVDLVPADAPLPPRLPQQTTVMVAGIALPHLALPAGLAGAVEAISHSLSENDA
jgi:HPr kinase/phosphorylase